MSFQFHPCSTIAGPMVIEPCCYKDMRGSFMETFKASEFAAIGINTSFIQDNHSLSTGSVIRGLHFQLPPKSQGKLLRVIEGKIWDVAVDLRSESPSFLQWLAIELDDQSNRMFYIPPGFAHGFATLSERVQLFYKCSEEYDANLDTGIRWNDPRLNLPWPLENPLISTKDAQLPLLDPDFFRRLRW